MTLDLWLLLGIAVFGIARVHYERWRDEIARRAKHLNGDYA